MAPHDNRRDNAPMIPDALVEEIKSTGLKLDDWQAEGLAKWAQAAVLKFAQGRSFGAADILDFPANRVAAYFSDLSDEDRQLLNADLGGKMAESIREKIKEASPFATLRDVLQQVAGDQGSTRSQASRAPPDNVRGRESRRGMAPHDNRRDNAPMIPDALVEEIKSTGLKLDDWQAEGLAKWAQAAVLKFAQGRSFGAADILDFPANRVAAYFSDLSDEDRQLLNADLGGKMAESIREKIKEAARSPGTTLMDVLAGDGGDGVASEAI